MSASQRERWLILLAILAFYAAAIGYVASHSKAAPPPIRHPRSYRCDVSESLPCTYLTQREQPA